MRDLRPEGAISSLLSFDDNFRDCFTRTGLLEAAFFFLGESTFTLGWLVFGILKTNRATRNLRKANELMSKL